MGLETALLLKIANKLLSKWMKRLPDDEHSLLPGDLEVALGIKYLAYRHGDLFSMLETNEAVNKEILEAVSERITNFQQQINVLKVDGILGTKSLSELLSSFGCKHKDPNQKRPLPASFRNQDSHGRDTNELWFLYHIESTPNIENAHMLIRRAWESWMRVTSLRAWEVPQENANVIIRQKYIDGGGPILAQAHVGPPQGYVLELDIDAGHSWNATRLQGAVCHEIGHLLGLREHTSGDGHLMSAIIREGIVDPSPEDVRRALNLGHLGPPPDRTSAPGQVEILPSDPEELKNLLNIWKLLNA